MGDTDPLPPEEIADLPYAAVRDACKARDIHAVGSGDVLRRRLRAYWEASIIVEVEDDPTDDLTPLEVYVSGLVARVDVSRFEAPHKRVRYILRALKRTASPALLTALSDSELADLITAAYERAN